MAQRVPPGYDMLATFELSTWRQIEGQDSTRYCNVDGQERMISALIGLTGEDGKPLTNMKKFMTGTTSI